MLAIALFPSTAVAAPQCGSPPDFDGDGRSDLAVGVVGEITASNRVGAVHVIYGSSTGLSASGDQFFYEGSWGLSGAAEPFDEFGAALSSGDFNGDGFSDLAVGVPGQDGAVQSVGAVHIIYGSATGLVAAGDQIFTQDTSGMADSAEAFDRFGSSLSACDLDGDGRDDLAIGVPGETVVEDSQGAVHVLYGSADGLTASGDQFLHQDVSGFADAGAVSDRFGASLTAGDFDNDGRDDVVVGIPEKNVNGESNAGAVHVIYGSATGLTASGDQVFHRDTSGVAGEATSSHNFGFSLAAGDFDNDGRDDVAIGVVGDLLTAGKVHVLYGSATGVSASGDQAWSQGSTGILGSQGFGDHFGFTVATGDFNDDARDDLVVGVPNDDDSGVEAGVVNLILGSASGLTATGDQLWHQNVSGVADSAEIDDFFGSAVTAGDWDGDGREDLAVGIQGENLPPGENDEGAVHAFYASASGLTASGDHFLHQNVSGIADTADVDDYFGAVLVGGKFFNFEL